MYAYEESICAVKLYIELWYAQLCYQADIWVPSKSCLASRYRELLARYSFPARRISG